MFTTAKSTPLRNSGSLALNTRRPGGPNTSPTNKTLIMWVRLSGAVMST